MTQQTINVGNIPNDNTGDPARTAFQKINSNFTDLYAGSATYNEGGAGAVTRTVTAKLQESVSVLDFGAVGDGSTDDTVAAKAAYATGKNVTWPSGLTYKLTDQLTVAAGVTTFAYGATLTWTAFGSVLASTVAARFATGNGVRLQNNCVWLGGSLKMNGVASPDSVSIPHANMSGAFWNAIVIGNFNTDTVASMAVATENVTVHDVNFELVSGARNHAILIAGYTRNIDVRNIVDTHTSTSVADMTVIEATWGSDNTNTWHPYHLVLDNIVMNGYADAGLNSLNRGVHFSGCYDVKATNIHGKDLCFPCTFYVGDPGDGSHGAWGSLTINAAQSGNINTDLVLDTARFNNFNIALRILGSANGVGSSVGTSPMRVTATNLSFKGQGAINGVGSWGSNIGTFISDASNFKISGGEIQGALYGIQVLAPASGATYTAPDAFIIEKMEIHSTGRQGILTGTVKNAKIGFNNVYTTGLLSTGAVNGSAINFAGSGCRLYHNTLGATGDTLTTYGIYESAADGAKSDSLDSVASNNEVRAAATQAYAFVACTDDWTNTAESGVTRPITNPNPNIVAANVNVTATTIPAVGIYRPGTNILGFSSNGTLWGQVDANGNLGLGITPSAWAAGSHAMQLGAGTADGAMVCRGDEMSIGSNVYYNGGWKYETSSFLASYYKQTSGTHTWYSYASGTAGNALSGGAGSVMSIDASGNLTVPAMYATTVTTPRNAFIDSTGKMGGISSVRASKSNIVPLATAAWINALNPVTFNYKKRDEAGAYLDEVEDERQYGLIAEDVEAINPDLCTYNIVNGQKVIAGVHYDRMIAPLIKAIQELTARVAILEAK